MTLSDEQQLQLFHACFSIYIMHVYAFKSSHMYIIVYNVVSCVYWEVVGVFVQECTGSRPAAVLSLSLSLPLIVWYHPHGVAQPRL